jgi:hypothetical protein
VVFNRNATALLFKIVSRSLKELAFPLKLKKTWKQLFPSVSTLKFTQNVYGPSLDLRITKNVGVPVTIVPEGTPGASVVAIKRVNELDYYNLGRDMIAKKLNHSGPKITAAVHVLGIKKDIECFKQIKVGNVSFDRYSQKAIERIKDGLKNKTIEEMWTEYRTK